MKNSTMGTDVHFVMFHVMGGLFLVLYTVVFLFSVALFLTRKSYRTLLFMRCLSSKFSSLKSSNAPHSITIDIIAIFLIYFVVFQTLSAVFWLVFQNVRETGGSREVVIALESTNISLAIVGYVGLTVVICAMLYMWFNIIFRYFSFKFSKKTTNVVNYLTIASICVVALIASLNATLSVAIMFVSNIRFSFIIINFVVTPIFVVIQLVLISVIISFGVIICYISRNLSTKKKVIVLKIGFALVMFIISTTVRVIGGVLLILKIVPFWLETFILRPLPDIILVTPVIVVLWPYDISRICNFANLGERLNTYKQILQPIYVEQVDNDDDDREATTSPNNHSGNGRGMGKSGEKKDDGYPSDVEYNTVSEHNRSAPGTPQITPVTPSTPTPNPNPS